MPTRYRVTHTEAVWERVEFGCEVPDDLPPEEHREYIHEHMPDLMSEAHDRGDYSQEVTGNLGFVDAEIEINEEVEQWSTSNQVSTGSPLLNCAGKVFTLCSRLWGPRAGERTPGPGPRP